MKSERGNRKTRIVVVSVCVIVVPMAVISAIAAYQVRNIADVLIAQELATLQQCARSAALELSYLVAQEEGRILELLQLESEDSLYQSLAEIEASSGDVSCFALLEDGGFLYPPLATAQDDSVTDPELEALVSARDVLFESLNANGIGRVHFAERDLIVSLRELRTHMSGGIIGICWTKDLVYGWAEEAALNVVPSGSVFELLDPLSRVLFRYPVHGSSADDDPGKSRLAAMCPLQADAFSWTVRVWPGDASEVGGLVRRQACFYTAVLILTSLVVAAGVWILIRLSLKEVELGQMKADFAANVSHELRTPLALIRAAGDALSMRQDLDQARKQRYLGIIRKETRRLAGLIDTVLRFAKVDRHEQVYELQTADVCEVVATFASDYRLHIEEEGFDLEVRMATGPLCARLDREAVQLVLVNLLDNAVKFSRDRKELSISVEDAGSEVKISMADRGIGIDPADHEKIFDSFFRSERASVKKTRGTGIGLALVREIVDAHRGRVQVASSRGEGATFSIILPKVESD